ncbi:MFS transporter [Paenibacillus sp. RC343]|uniref:MFS transporter n=1 Tax=Paenibacillus sp. RC343 TaxID=3045841 RepID=UPI0024BA5D6F|nr:MFS transporter [Paenibacillus sp. RC343]
MAVVEADLKKGKQAVSSNQKLSLLEKVSYGLGDAGSNLIYTVITTYLTFYFTDVYGLGAAAVGTLMLIARFVDMIDSPIFGVLIDRTNTKWGEIKTLDSLVQLSFCNRFHIALYGARIKRFRQTCIRLHFLHRGERAVCGRQ